MPSIRYSFELPATASIARLAGCFYWARSDDRTTISFVLDIVEKWSSSEVSDDPYLYTDSNALRNDFGEKLQSLLQQHETFFSGLRLRELIDQGPPESIDFDHLKKVHAYVFQDVYSEWAGQVRSIKIVKSERRHGIDSVSYAPPGSGSDGINARARALFEGFREDNELRGLSRQAFGEALTALTATLWQIHPFREGNTRCIMLLVYQISLRAGHPISMTYIGNRHRQFRDAMVVATRGDSEPLQNMILGSIASAPSSVVENLRYIAPALSGWIVCIILIAIASALILP